jgi:hypothetical protein
MSNNTNIDSHLPIVLNDIPFQPDPADLLRQAHIKDGSPDAHDFLRLLEQAAQVARPKAVYKENYIDTLGEDWVSIGGVTFHSRTLRLNLEHIGRVFPFVVTCGAELDLLALPPGDFLAPFWLDVIKTAALFTGLHWLNAILEQRYALGKTSSMSPGSGDVSVWSIEEQRLLFGLLGDVREAIGVILTESCLMTPNKTISGIIFPTEKAIRTCQVCQRENCPNRQAEFDPAAWEAIQASA